MTTLQPNPPIGYVFLDVDGIINPFDRNLQLDGWNLHQVGDYMVWQGKALIPWFQDLVERGVQFVWATTWINSQPGLRKLEKLYGLPVLPNIDKLERENTHLDRTSCGKRPGIIRWMTANKINTSKTPVVWVDDDLGPVDLDWAEGRGVRTVKPVSENGLSDSRYLRRIETALGLTVAA